MNDEKNTNKKEDIVCIWKEFPYLGDTRVPGILDNFKDYKKYEHEIKLMA